MQEKLPHLKIREIIMARKEQEIYPNFDIKYVSRTGEDKPLTTRGEKRVFKGDKRIFVATLTTRGDIDEETIRSLKKQFNKRRLRLAKWTLTNVYETDLLCLKLKFYSVY